MKTEPLIQSERLQEELQWRMIEYDAGDPARIQHFMKVYAFARMIGREEGLDERTQGILEAAALVHDIGIKISEEKYGDCNGAYQEAEGPAIAEAMLRKVGYPQDWIERVCYLVGHHHTYRNIVGADYQILVEADFLVNLYEGDTWRKEAQTVLERIFRTKAGSRLLGTMFLTSPRPAAEALKPL